MKAFVFKVVSGRGSLDLILGPRFLFFVFFIIKGKVIRIFGLLQGSSLVYYYVFIFPRGNFRVADAELANVVA